MKAISTFLSLVVSSLAMSQQAFAPFVHGVASGDPLADRVILWTRVSPDSAALPVTVTWRIATDASLHNVVNSGSVTTDATRDFTVKADAAGLQPATTYYYDFQAGVKHSAVGRTKTAPAGSVAQVRFAVATCAKYSKGYFNAYARIGDRDDIDAVIHLGDYIYESKDSGQVGRPMMPFVRCSTLTQFRIRYAQYHSDPDLVYARQRHPFINVWDDHEAGNDSWMYGSEHFPDSVQFAAIKQAGKQAYFEWIPIRENAMHPGRIYRTFRFGDLIDLVMLDTRLEGRMRQVPFDSMHIISDTNRTILGHQQYNWLISSMDNSTARWRILGQQVMMAPLLLLGNPLNNDQWDGYPAERAKLLEHIERNHMNNVVVLTGDVHAALANNLPRDIAHYDDATGSGSVAVEFITPAIASSKSNFSGVPFSLVKNNDPHIQYAELDRNGYLIIDVTADKVQGDFYFVATTDVPDTSEQLGASLYTLHGARRLFMHPTSVEPGNFSSHKSSMEISPNPSDGSLFVKVRNTPAGKMLFRTYDLQGKIVNEKMLVFSRAGTHEFSFGTTGLREGFYLLKGFCGTKELYSAKFAVAR